MKSFERKDWRRCSNCVHKGVCQKLYADKCFDHIYDASPHNYGDLGELLEPIYEWLKTHYPNETKLLIDYNSCELLTNHRTYFSNEIRNANLGETLGKTFESLIGKENLDGRTPSSSK